MALPSERVALDHATLIAVERMVEQIEDNLERLGREVDGLDSDRTYHCDCACYEEMADLQSDVRTLEGQILAINTLLARKKNKTKKRLRKEKRKKQKVPAEQLDNSRHAVAH